MPRALQDRTGDNMLGLMILRIACSLLSALAPLAAREAIDRPNVVLIYLDDSGYGDYAHNGNPVIETPAISKLAAGGANFTQFHVTSPACSASRYSLLTGRYPGRSGFGTWVIGPDSKPHLRTAETTLAEGLKAKGYATGIFGKWHLGNPNARNGMSPDSLPLAHGFDTWTGTNVSHDYDVSQLIQSDPAGKQPVPGYSILARDLPSDIAASTSLTNRYTEAAVGFIAANRERPFFAYIAHNQPHLGLFASEAFRGKSRRGLLGDVMAEIDDSVGRIMKALEDHGVANNTLVIFSSDNGPWIRFENDGEVEVWRCPAARRLRPAVPRRQGLELGRRPPGARDLPLGRRDRTAAPTGTREHARRVADGARAVRRGNSEGPRWPRHPAAAFARPLHGKGRAF